MGTDDKVPFVLGHAKTDGNFRFVWSEFCVHFYGTLILTVYYYIIEVPNVINFTISSTKLSAVCESKISLRKFLNILITLLNLEKINDGI